MAVNYPDRGGWSRRRRTQRTSPLFSAEEIISITQDVRQYVERAKSPILVGSDIGRIVLAYDLRTRPPTLIPLDYVEYDSEGMEWRCNDLGELMERLRASGWFTV